MDVIIYPGKLSGNIAAVPSKSQIHRYLICAALADQETTLFSSQTSNDILATVNCLNALGAKITITKYGYQVHPIASSPLSVQLPVGESGTTLRFLLPMVGALGIDATFLLAGRLPQRPLLPLWEEMERMGCRLSRPSADSIRCVGKLIPGEFHIPGNISSQFISGLLFACSILKGISSIQVLGRLESKPYIDMTIDAMETFGVSVSNYTLGNAVYHSPGKLNVEGDWSNAAFFLVANALGNEITISGLSSDSLQADRKVTEYIPALSKFTEIDASNTPDLIPILSILAANKNGAKFQNINRLRFKESDRVESICHMLHTLGCKTQVNASSLIVYPSGFKGGIINANKDHRIAMAAAIASTCSEKPITIIGAECVAKSYPAFWEDLKRLGGHHEQYIRPNT